MPIPKPSNKEQKDKFISRCMESLKNEKAPQAQKLAICYTTYKNSKRKKQMKGDNSEPDWDKEMTTNECIIIPK